METTATSKGQIVIPAAMRRKLGISAGTRLSVELDEEKGKIILRPITRQYINSLHGRLKGKRLMRELKEEKAREKRR